MGAAAAAAPPVNEASSKALALCDFERIGLDEDRESVGGPLHSPLVLCCGSGSGSDRWRCAGRWRCVDSAPCAPRAPSTDERPAGAAWAGAAALTDRVGELADRGPALRLLLPRVLITESIPPLLELRRMGAAAAAGPPEAGRSKVAPAPALCLRLGAAGVSALVDRRRSKAAELAAVRLGPCACASTASCSRSAAA